MELPHFTLPAPPFCEVKGHARVCFFFLSLLSLAPPLVCMLIIIIIIITQTAAIAIDHNNNSLCAERESLGARLTMGAVLNNAHFCPHRK